MEINEIKAEKPAPSLSSGKIIRKVETGAPLSHSEFETASYIHRRHKDTRPTKPFWGSSNYQRFVVSLLHSSHYEGLIMVAVKNGRKVPVHIAYTAKAIEGLELKVIKNFFQVKNLDLSIRNKVQFWLEKMYASQSKGDNMFANQGQVAIAEIRKQGEKIGIAFPDIYFSWEQTTLLKHLKSKPFLVELKGAPAPIRLELEATLDADPNNPLLAATIATDESEALELLVAGAQEHVLRQLDTETFLNKAKQGLGAYFKPHLQALIKKEGRIIKSLQLHHEFRTVKKRLVIANQNVRVPIIDLTERIPFRYSLTLKPHPQRGILASLFLIEQLKTEFEEGFNTVFSQKINYEEILSDLNGKPTELLKTYMAPIFAERGREIADLEIKLETDYRLKEFHEIKEQVIRCNIENTYVDILVDLKLRLVDEARWINSGKTDIDQIIQEKLSHHVTNHISNTTFPHLITKDNWKEPIYTSIKEETEDLGFELLHMVVLPKTWWDTWQLKGTSFTIGEQEEFVTQLMGGTVRLKAEINCLQPDLSELSRFIHLNEDFQQELKEATLQAIRETLFQLYPQEFYLNFNSTEDRHITPVKEQLEESIAKTLRTKFNISESTINLIPLDTPITQRLRNLKSQLHPFEFGFPGHDFSIAGKFSITELNFTNQGWQAFYNHHNLALENESTDAALKEITEHLQDFMVEKLTFFLGSNWDGLIDRNLRTELWTMFNEAAEMIQSVFGLEMKVTIFKPLTPIETQMKEYQLQQEWGMFQQQYEMIQRTAGEQNKQQEAELHAIGGALTKNIASPEFTDETYKQLNARRNSLIERLMGNPAPVISKFQENGSGHTTASDLSEDIATDKPGTLKKTVQRRRTKT